MSDFFLYELAGSSSVFSEINCYDAPFAKCFCGVLKIDKNYLAIFYDGLTWCRNLKEEFNSNRPKDISVKSECVLIRT